MESDSGGNNMSLPDELVVQILSKLPVKSLLRFKCVCKAWLSIITHPQFIKTHLCRSIESPDCHRLLLKTHLCRSTNSPDCHRPLMKTKPSGIFGFVSFDFENPNHEPKSPQCPFEKDSFFLLALCSCDGLILVCVLVKDPDGSFVAELKCTVRKSLILWNPSIGSYKRISCPHEITFSSRFGLGYDSAVDDYRVFIVSRENETSVMVYNSRNDSWNIFIDNRYVLSSWTHQAVLNGVVHWVMCPYESVSCVIVYFDLVKEKFKEVPPPNSWKKDDEMRLVVLGEQLCVYCDIDVKQIEVYAMKEYGNKESWTRLFVIPCGILKSINICNQNCICTAVRPLCLTKNGQILIQVGSWVVGNYDPKDSAFLSFDSERGWMPLPYVETLISPGGGV